VQSWSYCVVSDFMELMTSHACCVSSNKDLGARLAVARREREAPVACLGELAAHEPLHLRDEQQGNLLPLADAAHAKGALRVVTKVHVLAERKDGARVGELGDVHARGVHLVEEGEALVRRDA